MAETLEISVKVDCDALVKRLGKLAGAEFDKALQSGLAEGLEYARSEVVMQAQERGLQSRTATLLGGRGVQWEMDPETLTGWVGVPPESPANAYAYLLTDVEKTITPVRGQYLTIPFGENIAGGRATPKFFTVAQLEAAFPGKVLRRGMALGVGEDDEFELYFVLARSVKVRGRNVLGPGVEAARDDMTAAIQERVDGLVAKGE